MAGGRHLVLIMALAASTALAGCQQTGASLDSSLSTGSTAPVSAEETVDLAQKWEADPGNINKGLAYANALESSGRSDQQFKVYAKLVAANPGNAKLQGLYGKKLLTAGRAAEAVAPLEAAAAASDADWRIHSALGTAYDQQGRYDQARSRYQMVLAKDPQNLTVLNNLGMSYALEGNLKLAETTLRTADAVPKSNREPRIRQNLALVVGLQGHLASF
mgnify:CR=1 FL=1